MCVFIYELVYTYVAMLKLQYLYDNINPTICLKGLQSRADQCLREELLKLVKSCMQPFPKLKILPILKSIYLLLSLFPFVPGFYTATGVFTIARIHGLPPYLYFFHHHPQDWAFLHKEGIKVLFIVSIIVLATGRALGLAVEVCRCVCVCVRARVCVMCVCKFVYHRLVTKVFIGKFLATACMSVEDHRVASLIMKGGHEQMN